MLKIDTTRLTDRQLHDVGPLLPPGATFTSTGTVELNPAECRSRDTLIAWLGATAPVYWYDGTVVAVEKHHIDRGRPSRPRSCALALALHDATGEHWDVTPSNCHTFPTAARTWYVPYALSSGARAFLERFDLDPKPLIAPATFVLRMSGAHQRTRGPQPTLGLYHPECEPRHA